jgi:hypothetical protein
MQARMPRYIHKPLQVLWFDINEIMIIVMFYLAAMSFGGLMWLILIGGPVLFIPYKRKQSRGYFQHVLYQVGFVELAGYPVPAANQFRE